MGCFWHFKWFQYCLCPRILIAATDSSLPVAKILQTFYICIVSFYFNKRWAWKTERKDRAMTGIAKPSLRSILQRFLLLNSVDNRFFLKKYQQLHTLYWDMAKTKKWYVGIGHFSRSLTQLQCAIFCQHYIRCREASRYPDICIKLVS